MQKIVKLGLVVSILVVAACAGGGTGGAGGGSGGGIKATTPAGTFEGKPWTMTKANVSINSAKDKLSVKMFADPVADCAFSSMDGGYLLFSMPAKLGQRPLKFSFDFSDPDNQTVTFVTPPSSNNIATDGLLDLTALSDAGVTLGLSVKSGTKNDINGTFTTTFCP